jgi:hypothetical protein
MVPRGEAIQDEHHSCPQRPPGDERRRTDGEQVPQHFEAGPRRRRRPGARGRGGEQNHGGGARGACFPR